MAHPLKNIMPVKLILGLIFKEIQVFEKVKIVLIKKLGEIDFESPCIDFSFTNYYCEEMGSPLFRKFLSFEKLIKPTHIVKIKYFCSSLEERFSYRGRRKINIDPGYINLYQLVLTSFKPYYQRINLGRSVFAEVTLHFQKQSFRVLEWTYPDYRTSQYIEIFNRIRQIYKSQMKNVLPSA